MRIVLVSLDQAWEDKGGNSAACRALIRKAKEYEAELVVFPEMTLTGFSMDTGSISEDQNASKTVELFRGLAEEFRLAIVFGVVFFTANKATNNALIVDGNGILQESYAKIHPFSYAGEDKVFEAGDKIAYTKLGINIGLTICYDLRFPEIYSALGKHCDLIVNIANWPARRISHWNALLKARAIENQVFVAGVNRTGIDGNGLEYVRSSQVVNPNGEVLQPVITEEYMDVVDIDPGYATEFRRSFPTTKDRKPELYKSML